MARIRDYQVAEEIEDSLPIKIKIVKKSNRSNNDKSIIHFKKKPWKKGRDQAQKVK